jgi:hypothetical protein
MTVLQAMLQLWALAPATPEPPIPVGSAGGQVLGPTAPDQNTDTKGIQSSELPPPSDLLTGPFPHPAATPDAGLAVKDREGTYLLGCGRVARA